MRVPRRLLIIAGQLGLGGAERQLYFLAQGLRQRGCESVVLNLNPAGPDHWGVRLTGEGFRVLEVPKRFRPARIVEIAWISRQVQADLIHGLHTFVNGYASITAHLLGCPSVGSVRFLPTVERLQEIPLGLWRRLCLRGVDRLACNTRAARDLLLQRWPDLRHLRIIPNGVPIPERRTLEEQRRRVREQWGIPHDDLIVGFVGTLNENKNPGMLLEALGSMNLPSTVHVVIIGDGPLRSCLEQSAAQSSMRPRTVFLGSVPSADRLMPAFDILCQTSKTEGMPNVLLEASAAALPVIATSVGGVAEVVSDGVTGLTMPPDAVSPLIDALSDLLGNHERRQTMGQAGRRHVRAKFSIDGMVDAYLALYSCVLGDRNGDDGARSR